MKDAFRFFALTIGIALFTTLIAMCFLFTDAEISAFLGVR